MYLKLKIKKLIRCHNILNRILMIYFQMINGNKNRY
nr:MAG TPA: hypothetical protein [Caudoviricetes sp.]